jgi:anti-anti-sigma regulatory factor
MEKKSKKLKVSSLLSCSISSRDAVIEILEKEILMLSEAIVYLDFTKIDFISRSAAHELLKMKERFENRKSDRKDIIFLNPDSNVAAMIRIVAANKAYTPNKKSFNPEKVDIGQLV